MFTEELVTLAGDVVNFRAEIQLDVNVGKIEIAERDEIFVADFFAGEARAFEAFDRTAIVSAQIVEIGDVVVGREMDQRDVVVEQQIFRAFVGGQAFAKSLRLIRHIDMLFSEIVSSSASP